MLVLVTLGLSVSVASLLNGRGSVPWPWTGSEPVLLAGLSLIVAVFGVYLSCQQRKLQHLRGQLNDAQEMTVLCTRRHYQRLMALYGVSQAVARETNPMSIFTSIVKATFDFFDADQVSLMLLDRKTDELVVKAAHGHEHPSDVIGARRSCGEGVAGWVAQNKRPVSLGPNTDRQDLPNTRLVRDELTAAVIVPILLRDELVGVLNVSSRTAGQSYDEEDMRALEVFAGNAGVVIRHAEQAEWMRQTIRTLEESLAHHAQQKSA